MDGHAELYDSLPARRRLDFEQRAEKRTAANHARVEEDLEHLNHRLQILQSRIKQTKTIEGSLNRVGTCRFDEIDFEALSVALEDQAVTRAVVEEWKGAKTQAPPKLDPADEADLVALADEPEREDAPRWLKVVAYNREKFEGCTLLVTDPTDEQVRAYKFLYALQNPVEASFLPLQVKVTPPHPVLGPVRLRDQAWGWTHEWTYAIGSSLAAHGIPHIQPDGANVQVVPSTYHQGGCVAVSGSAGVLFRDFTVGFLDGPERAPVVARPPPPRELYDEFPWLRDIFEPPAVGRGGGSSSAGGGATARRTMDEEPATEDAIKAAWAMLLDKRAEIDILSPDTNDFMVFVRGGKWTLEKKKAGYDCIVAIARRGVPAQWCQAYNLPRMKSFSIAKHTEHHAVQLALEVARRYQYFYNIWREALEVDDDFGFTPKVVEAYTEDPAFVEWACELGRRDLDSDTYTRMMEVRRLVPREDMA